VLKGTARHTGIVEHEIHVGDASPIHCKPYRIPYAQQELVKKELDDMLEANIIQLLTSPWASTISLGGKRMGVLKLNKVAKFNTYPMSRIKEISKKIGSPIFISTLDLAKGYWQIPMMAASNDTIWPV